MYLKSVYVSGFKSFSCSSPKEVKFIKGINCIVGPNGRGKSNLIDAICFALGIDTKKLRVNKVDELLTTRGLEKESYSCIQLIFSREDGNDDELKVYIYKEKPTRQFKLNGKIVTLRMVKNYLYQNGLRNFSNFLILQNNVTTLMFKNCKELSEMIIDVSGGLHFKEQYSKALEELNNWKVNEELILEKIKKLENIIKEDLLKLEKINRLKECNNEIQNLKDIIQFKYLNTLNNEINNIEQDLQSLQLELNNLKNKFSNENNFQNELQLKKNELLQFKENEITPLESKLKKETMKYSIVKEEIPLIEEQLKEMIQLESNKKEDENKLEELELERISLKTKLNSILLLIQKEQDELDLLQNNKVTNDEQQLENVKNELKLKRNILQDFINDKLNTKNQLDNILKKQLKIKNEINNLNLNYNEEFTDINIIDNDIETNRKELLQLERQNEELIYLYNKEKLYFNKSLQNLLETSNDIFITKIKFKKIANDYLLPLNILSSNYLKVIITETSEMAKELLSKNKKNQITIWPLDRLDYSYQQNKLNYQRRIKEEKQLDFIIPVDLLIYDQNIEPAIIKAFCDFVISKSDEQAIQLLKYGISSITLNGNKHMRSRIIGGNFNLKENLIEKKFEMQKKGTEILKLKTNIENIKNQLSTLQLKREHSFNYLQNKSKYNQLNEQHSILQQEINILKTKLTNIQQEIDSNSEIISFLENKLNSQTQSNNLLNNLMKQKLELNNEITTKNEEIETLKELIENNNLLINEKEKKQNEIDLKRKLLTELEESKKKLLNELEIKRNGYNNLMSEYNTIEIEKNNNLQYLNNYTNKITEIESKIEKNNNLLKNKQLEKEKFNEDLSSIDENNDKLKLSIDELKHLQQHYQKKKLELNKEVKNIYIDINDIENKQRNLQLSKKRLEWISKSILNLNEGLEESKEKVEKHNEIAFNKIKELFENYFTLMIQNKIATIQKIGNKVEDGIEIIVKYNLNDDKVIDLSQLSGGEKTMLSIAFLFSIASFNKSMFYLLDEIDAALDEERQKVIARLMTKLFKDQQVIVISHHCAFQNESNRIIHL
ncbi:hypothetical protein ABK040_016777 [Willaertia magna]